MDQLEHCYKILLVALIHNDGQTVCITFGTSLDELHMYHVPCTVHGICFFQAEFYLEVIILGETQLNIMQLKGLSNAPSA